MTFTILVACLANMCRSPLAEVVMAETFAQAGLDESVVRVTSAGVLVPKHAHTCPRVGESVSDERLTRRLAKTLPRQVVEKDSTASLILAADRWTRAELVRGAPGIHTRAFTLRHALALMTEIDLTTVTEADPAVRLARTVAVLNSSRGLGDAPGRDVIRPRSRPWRSVSVHTHDIPDAHRGPGVPHRVTTRLTADSARRLAQLLAGAAQGGQGHGEGPVAPTSTLA